MLVSWEDGSAGCNWVEESVCSPAGKFLVRLEEGAVCVDVVFPCCSAELRDGRSEAGWLGQPGGWLGKRLICAVFQESCRSQASPVSWTHG